MILEDTLRKSLPLEKGLRQAVQEYYARGLVHFRVILFNATGLAIMYLALRYPGSFAAVAGLIFIFFLLSIGLVMFNVQAIRKQTHLLAKEFALTLEMSNNRLGSEAQRALKERFWKTYSLLVAFDKSKEFADVFEYYLGSKIEVGEWLNELASCVRIAQQGSGDYGANLRSMPKRDNIVSRWVRPKVYELK